MKTSEWQKKWKIQVVGGSLENVKLKAGSEFKLVLHAGFITWFRAEFPDDPEATKFWKHLHLIPNGNTPPALPADFPTPLVYANVNKMVTDIGKQNLVSTARLECQVEIPADADVELNDENVLVPSGETYIGYLQMFQVPKALGDDALLLVQLRVDAEPGGVGGGGSVRG